MTDPTTIDILVHPIRWIADTRYRNTMLARARPPGTWRHVTRGPDGKVCVLAVTTFLEGGGVRRVEVKR